MRGKSVWMIVLILAVTVLLAGSASGAMRTAGAGVRSGTSPAERKRKFCFKAGGQSRNRTSDTAVFSRVLYQLSYLAGRRANCTSNRSTQSTLPELCPIVLSIRFDLLHAPDRSEARAQPDSKLRTRPLRGRLDRA